MVDVGNGALVRQHLLERGVHVRDCASFGLPGHVRMAGRGGRALDRLMVGLDSAPIAERPALGVQEGRA